MKSAWNPQSFTKDALWVGKAGAGIVLLLASLLPALALRRWYPEIGLVAGISTSLAFGIGLYSVYSLPIRRMEVIALLGVLLFLMAAAALALGILALAA